MKKWLQYLRRDMLRPIIYQIFTRLIYALTIVLLWNEFANPNGIPLSWGFIVPVLFYLLLGWFAYLRLDGIRAPKFDRRLFLRRKKADRFSSGDIADYLDHKPVSFEEMENEEKDACLILSNLSVAAIFFIASIFLG